MGLDIVEFVMGVEEAFGITLPDDVAPKLATSRQLIDYIHKQLPTSNDVRCLSQRGFYAVRRAVADRVGCPRSLLRPNTPLLQLLPRQNAQTVWAEVGSSLDCPQWPRVRGDSWLAWIFMSNRPRTLGDAARHVATFTPGVLKADREGWSWPEVAEVVDGLIRHHFAIHEYHLDDRFVEDLGIDWH